MYYSGMGLCSGHGNSVVIRELSLYPQSLLAKLTVGAGGLYFLRAIKIVASQSEFSNLFCPLEGQRNQLEIEAEHCRRTKL